MKFIALPTVLLALSFSASAMATSKICPGSKKSDLTKDLAVTIEVNPQSLIFKTIKGNFFSGNFRRADPAKDNMNKFIYGRNGETYFQFVPEAGEQREYVLVDDVLLASQSTGWIHVRSRDDANVDLIFICHDPK